jgi:cytochrome c peroxidase
MHDGRISKLKDVIHHYANSSNWVKPISKELKTKNNLLSPTEEKDLLKFLKTLTDRTFLLNTNFQYHSPN